MRGDDTLTPWRLLVIAGHLSGSDGCSFITHFNDELVFCYPGGSTTKPYLPWERERERARNEGAQPRTALTQFQAVVCAYAKTASFSLASQSTGNWILVNVQEERTDKRANCGGTR